MKRKAVKEEDKDKRGRYETKVIFKGQRIKPDIIYKHAQSDV